MDLTPEQIDRQTFRIRRRGYDIMQVREFLRSIAQELRARQRVRESLADEHDATEAAERVALDIIARAEARADEIVTEAHAVVDRSEEQAARVDAEEILAAARAEAQQLLDDAEAVARARSDEVLSDTQARLDQLLDRQRDIEARINLAEHRLHESVPGDVPELTTSSEADARAIDPEPSSLPESEPAGDSAFADYVKSAIREELRID